MDDKDRMGWVFMTRGDQEVLLVSAEGQAIRFDENEVRSMGLAAGGVAGMKLKKGEKIVFAGTVDPEGDLLTVTATGYTKRTVMSEYGSQGRNGSGIIAHKIDKRTGSLIDALVINPEHRDLVVFITEKGIAKPLEIGDIPALGRSTLGDATTVGASRGDSLVAVKKIEGVPGFVGDETLSPPPAPSNGKATRTPTKPVAVKLKPAKAEVIAKPAPPRTRISAVEAVEVKPDTDEAKSKPARTRRTPAQNVSESGPVQPELIPTEPSEGNGTSSKSPQSAKTKVERVRSVTASQKKSKK